MGSLTALSLYPEKLSNWGEPQLLFPLPERPQPPKGLLATLRLDLDDLSSWENLNCPSSIPVRPQKPTGPLVTVPLHLTDLISQGEPRHPTSREQYQSTGLLAALPLHLDDLISWQKPWLPFFLTWKTSASNRIIRHCSSNLDNLSSWDSQLNSPIPEQP